MKLFKKKKERPYIIDEIDLDGGDASIIFQIGNERYFVDLSWWDTTIDVEFSALYDENYDTTNQHEPFKVLNRVYLISDDIRQMISDLEDIKFDTLSFKSSNKRNGKEDERSKKVRDKFFMRRILREYPKAINITENEEQIIIKLYGI